MPARRKNPHKRHLALIVFRSLSGTSHYKSSEKKRLRIGLTRVTAFVVSEAIIGGLESGLLTAHVVERVTRADVYLDTFRELKVYPHVAGLLIAVV